MFFRQTARVEVPIEVIDQHLRDRLGADGLQQETHGAVQDGSTALVRVGLDGALTKQVIVDFLPPYRRGSVIAFPIRWRATGPWGALLPTLDANIELAPTTDNAFTEVVFVGSYRPPLGRAGGAVDRALLHRVVDATLQGYLRRLTEAVSEPGHQATADLADYTGPVRRRHHSLPHINSPETPSQPG